jgi:hypothetical protein
VRFPGVNDQGKTEAGPPMDEERLWNQMLKAGGCVDCKTKPKSFIEGPSGGMSTNVFCPHCGQGYNLTPIAQWAQRIHKDERYIQK